MNKIIKYFIWKFNSFFRALQEICSDFLLNTIGGGYCCPIFFRRVIYNIAGNHIGKSCRIHPKCFLGPGKGKLILGQGSFVNYFCWFDLGDDIIIGSYCNIAMNVHFINGTHEIGDAYHRASTGITKKIVIGDGSWIGADTVVLPGVKIGKGCVVGAGSLVIKDLEDNGIYFGRPAKLYKKIEGN